MTVFPLRHFLLLFGGIIGLGFLSMPTFAQDAGKMHDLQQVIDAQQKQLEVQQKQLDAQRQLLQDLRKQMESLVRGEDTEEVPAVAEKPAAKPVLASTKSTPPVDKVVTSGEERVKLAISGWVNRAVNILDDGKNTDSYFVDNDNAESQVRFVGTAKINDDLTLGSKIELSIAPNRAGEVNQNDKDPGDVFEQRITEATLDSKRYGKLSLGRGYTASYKTAGSDLSKTLMISYVTIADTAGGMLIRQKSDDSLTDLDITKSYIPYDGFSRQSRLRYDTPRFNGFMFSTSFLSDWRYDAGLRWGGQGHGFKAVASAGLAEPKLDDAGLIYSGSASFLHEKTGLNLTFSTGLIDRDTQSDGKNYYGKIGWITKFFPVGETAFAIDYTKTDNQPTEDDKGYSIGLTAVQYFEKYGTSIYGLYRKYSLDRDVAPVVHDIDVVSIEAMVQF